MSGFQRLPTRAEVVAYEDDWITDMQLAYELYRFQTNTSPVLKNAEELRHKLQVRDGLENGAG